MVVASSWLKPSRSVKLTSRVFLSGRMSSSASRTYFTSPSPVWNLPSKMTKTWHVINRRATCHQFSTVSGQHHAIGSDDNNTTATLDACRLTPPRRPGITSDIFQPTRPSLSPLHFPLLLWQHPCWNFVKVRQKSQKIFSKLQTRTVPDTRSGPDNEAAVSREKRTTWRLARALHQSAKLRWRYRACSQSDASDVRFFCVHRGTLPASNHRFFCFCFPTDNGENKYIRYYFIICRNFHHINLIHSRYNVLKSHTRRNDCPVLQANIHDYTQLVYDIGIIIVVRIVVRREQAELVSA